MKKKLPIILACLALLCLSGLAAYALLRPGEPAPPPALPEPGEVRSVTLEQGDRTVECPEENVEELLSILREMKPTDKPTIQDFPQAEDYTAVHLHSADGGVCTLFVYEEKGKTYVEQPYQGIYQPPQALKTLLTQLLSG